MSQKNIIKITESELKSFIAESLKQILKEDEMPSNFNDINNNQQEETDEIRQYVILETIIGKMISSLNYFIKGGNNYTGTHTLGLKDNNDIVYQLANTLKNMEQIRRLIAVKLNDYNQSMVDKISNSINDEEINYYL